MTKPRWVHVWLNNANVLTCGVPGMGEEAGMDGGGTEERAGTVLEV